MKLRILLASLIAFATLSPLRPAHAMLNDFGIWTAINTQGTFNSNWGWFFEN